MAFPTRQTTLTDALARAQRTAARVRDVATANKNTMAAEPVSVEFLLVLLDDLRAANAMFTQVAGRTGIAAEAQAQLGQDVSAGFVAMTSAVDAAGAFIISALPKDDQNRLLAETIDAAGDRSPVTFTPAQTSQLRNLLDDVIATIEA